MSLSETNFPSDCLVEFSGAECPVAAQLADAVISVSHNALDRGLRLPNGTTKNRDEGEQDHAGPIRPRTVT